MILAGMVASFGGIGSPTLQSALTKHIPSDRTGQMLGATGLLHALARVVAPTIFNLIYSQTVGIFTQAVFVCLASVFVLASIMSWFVKPNRQFTQFPPNVDLLLTVLIVYLNDPHVPGASSVDNEEDNVRF